jgi:hypothetical protein
MLETQEFDARGTAFTLKDATVDPNTNEFPPPTDRFVYRIKRGPLGKQDDPVVDGVVLAKEMIVLRTDSLIAEALLGQADALDSYAMQKQGADADASVLENKRNELIQQALAGIQDPKQRADTYAEIYRPVEELELNLVRGEHAGDGGNGGGS